LKQKVEELRDVMNAIFTHERIHDTVPTVPVVGTVSVYPTANSIDPNTFPYILIHTILLLCTKEGKPNNFRSL